MDSKELKDVEFFVEADSFAHHQLWKEFNKDIKWKQIMSGFAGTIGEIKIGKEKMPVTVSFSFAKLNGHLICFYHPTSQVVDYRMIEKFLHKEYPVKYDNGTRLAYTDANNFHNCYHFCNKEK